MGSSLEKYFQNLYETKKIGHAFLVCNTFLDKITKEIENILSNYFFEEKININANEDIIIIEPENNMIKTEKIKNLQEKLKTTSQNHNKKVYIIDQCENLNDSSGNKILKLLEEPENNIYAILISNNIENVLQTIRSRCQILNFYNVSSTCDIISSCEEEELINILNFIFLLESKKTRTIAYYTKFIKNYKDREKLKYLLNIFIFIYRDLLNILLEKEIEYFDKKEKLKEISKLIDIDKIIKRLITLNKNISLINENLNINLLIDRVIIEMMGD